MSASSLLTVLRLMPSMRAVILDTDRPVSLVVKQVDFLPPVHPRLGPHVSHLRCTIGLRRTPTERGGTVHYSLVLAADRLFR